MNDQKGFASIILIILVLALVGAGAYFVSTRHVAPSTYCSPLGPSVNDKGQVNVCQCLAYKTLIDTPSGSVQVKNIQVGTPIWTTDKTGNRVSGTVTKTSRVSVPSTHQMVHLILNDGRNLYVSPRHPTTDGRTVGDLTQGDRYDGATITSTQRVAYDEGATYDVLPSGDTGFYWANGILMSSTL